MKPTNTQIKKMDQITVVHYQTQLRQAARTPWLAAIMLKRARLLRARLNYFYQTLTSLPRRWRRQIKKLLAAGLVGAALLLAFGPTPSVHAATITVSTNTAPLADDGYCSLTEAILNANSDSQVYTTLGECDAGSGIDTINLSGNTYAYTAAYSGSNALPPITSEIVIEGNNSTISRDSGSATQFRVMQVNGSGDLTLRQVTISGGDSGSANGGGILNSGNLTIENSVITGNRTQERGGGIDNLGTLLVQNSVLHTNTGTEGSGVSNRNGATLTINETVIRDNMAVFSGYFGGGGIFNYNSDLTINNSTISSNNNRHGGAVENVAYAYNSSEVATLTVNNSTISGNSASQLGGGISNFAVAYNAPDTALATVTINDSTVTDNTGGFGGAVNNREFGASGSETAVVNLHRSLISGNTATSSANEISNTAAGGAVNAADYNLFGDSSQSTANAFSGFAPGATDFSATSDSGNPTPLSSILDPLGDNGGHTTPDGTILTHALATFSPAKNLIPTTDPNCNPGSSTDQRGADRANGPGSGGPACDAGAFEDPDVPSTGPITIAPGAAGVYNGDGCSLVEAIISANTDASYSDCVAGSGADTLTLAGNTYTYNNAYGPNTALPTITSEITIEANGATITRDSGAGNFRIMRVDEGGILTLNEVMLTGGHASDGGLVQTRGGGGLFNYNGNVTINNSTISGNSAPGSIYNRGGGIRNYAFNGYDSTLNTAVMTINASTISGNTSNRGGGIANDTYNYHGNGTAVTLTINDSTITNNSSTGNGGGIQLFRSGFFGPITNILNLNRSIVSGNFGSSIHEIYTFGVPTINAGNYNLIGHSDLTNGDAFNGFSPSGSDITATSDGTMPTPLTSILNKTAINNGGPTFTVALSDVSIAIDVIPTSDPNCNPGSSADQRGAGRASGFGSGGSACDIGAYEEAFSAPLSPTVTGMLTAVIRQELAHPGIWAALVGFAGMITGFVLGWLKRSEQK